MIMDEIKETLGILKARWHEVGILIGLWLLLRLTALALSISPALMQLVQVISIGLSLFVLIVSTGFLRSIYLNQNQRQSLPALIQTGKPFFWRFLGLSILAGLAMMLPYWLLSICGFKGGALNHNTALFMKLLLAKLTLLIPAIIIVTDCSIPKSFSLMWKTKLFQAKAKPLLIFFLAAKIVLPTLPMLFFPGFWRASSSITWTDGVPLLCSIFLHFMGLMLSVMAIRFVSSLEITNSQSIQSSL
jgi:hypothetical protein